MKTKYMIGLALAVCLGLALQSPGKKPVPPPDPEAEFPFTYQRVDLPAVPGQTGSFGTQSLNDNGVICGSYATDDAPGGYRYWSFRWAPNPDGISYDAEQIELLDLNYSLWDPLGAYFLNNRGEVAGAYSYPHGPPVQSWLLDVMVTNASFTAVLYDADGTRHALWSNIPGDMSRSCAINHLGEVVVVDCRDRTPEDAEYEDPAYQYLNDVLATYIVSPLDTDGDGAGDTWFVDNDGDGINDLALPLGIANPYTAINSAGVITLSGEGGIIVPDFEDADGDGNPWFADGNGDGFNDRIFGLLTPGGNGTAVANDITDSGLIAGACQPDNAGAFATFWLSLDSEPVVVPPPKDKLDKYSLQQVNSEGTAVGRYSLWITRKGMRPNRAYASGYFIYYDGISYPTGVVPTSDGSYISQISDLNASGTILNWYGTLYIEP